MEKKYTKEELETFERINCMMWLIDIEIGQPVTEKQFKAIRFFLGDLIDQVKAIPMTSTTIHFDKLGQAYSVDNNGLIKSVNGQKIIGGEPTAKESGE